jgi:outer membrane protein OmpA-like peptidoglycan-associated protein
LALFAAFAPFPAQAQQASEPIEETCIIFGPYVAFFSQGSAKLEGKAIPMLDNMLENWRGCEIEGVRAAMAVDGYSDTGEPAGISRARADAVRTYFRKHGVPEDHVHRFDCGLRKPRIGTTNMRDLRNRRVEIFFGPPEQSRLIEAPGCDTMQP